MPKNNPTGKRANERLARGKKLTLTDEEQQSLAVELRNGLKTKSQLAEEYGISSAAITRWSRKLAWAGQGLVYSPPRSEAGNAYPPEVDPGAEVAALNAQRKVEEVEDDSALSLAPAEWLRGIRDNINAPWSERVKCGIALARIEKEATGEAWQPPEGVAWAEAIVAAISEQPIGVRRAVVALIGEAEWSRDPQPPRAQPGASAQSPAPS